MEEVKVGCARPTGGPVGEAVEEKKQKEELEILYHFINEFDEPFFISTLDGNNHNYLFNNQARAKLYGLSSDEMNQDHIFWEKALLNEDKQKTVETIHQQNKSEQTNKIINFRINTPQGVKNIKESRFILKQNNRLLVGGLQRDVTNEKKQNDKLELLSLAINNIDDVFVWDCSVQPPNQKYHYLSDSFEKITGFTKEEVRHNPHWWYDRVHPDDLERIFSEKAKKIFPYTLTFRLKTKKKGYITVNITANRTLKNGEYHYLGVLRKMKVSK